MFPLCYRTRSCLHLKRQLRRPAAAGSLLVGLLAGLPGTTTSWASLEIHVTAVSGISGLTSKAYTPGDPSGNSFTSTWSGGWNAQIVGGAVNSTYPLNATFLAFCTDIGNTMNDGTWTYEPLKFDSAGTSTANGIPPDPNWATPVSGHRASFIYNQHINDVDVDNSITVSAMAIAVWEALYESGNAGFNVLNRDTSSGAHGFKVTLPGLSNPLRANADAAVALANNWLADLPASGSDYTWFAEQESKKAFPNHDVQSLIGPPSPVPEPTTIIAGALLLLPFGLTTIRMMRRRRLGAECGLQSASSRPPRTSQES